MASLAVFVWRSRRTHQNDRLGGLGIPAAHRDSLNGAHHRPTGAGCKVLRWRFFAEPRIEDHIEILAIELAAGKECTQAAKPPELIIERHMKLALNRALTIGTLDGANVEIKEEVGDENIFIFGLTVEEVHALLKKGYDPQEYYMKNEELRAVVDWVGSNYFTLDEPPGVLSMLRDNLYYSDPFLCLADFESYSECQKKVEAAFRQEVALGENGHS